MPRIGAGVVEIDGYTPVHYTQKISEEQVKTSVKCAFSVLALAFAMAGPASGAVIQESEPNDTLATAQVINSLDLALRIEGTRTFADPSDDFFSFSVQAPGWLRITSNSPDGSADSIMGLFGPAGNLLASNDDGSSGFMSSIDFLVTPGMTGLFTIGFSGFNPGLLACGGGVTECYDTDGDFIFDTFVAGGGSGGSTGWTYTIRVAQLVPEPPSLALLALALPLVIGFDRRRAKGSKANARESRHVIGSVDTGSTDVRFDSQRRLRGNLGRRCA